MASISSGVMAVLGIIFGLTITFYGWYMVVAMGSYMPIALMKVLFWIGFLLTWGLCIVLNPILMITKGEGDWKDSVFGMGTFFAGTFGMLISYYIIPPLLETLGSMSGVLANLVSLGWMFLIIFWVLIMMVIPNYKVVRSHTR